MNQTIMPRQSLQGTFQVPGDKSISHRAVMFGAIAKGTTEISGFLTGEDCLSTISCFRKLGIPIEQQGTNVAVHGKGLRGLSAPMGVLDVGNSGTTMRLLSGLLAGQHFSCDMTGDASIQKRPMDRVISPLREMGAAVTGRDGTGFAPLHIEGRALKGIAYTLPMASAQVKSAVLLAGLYASGATAVTEPERTRDHTEIMLNGFGADIRTEGKAVTCRPVEELFGQTIHVPGDISSAAFLIVAALILPGSHIVIENVGINETRTGIIEALQAMGGHIAIKNQRAAGGEPVADIEVMHSKLHGAAIEGGIIPRMIDEIPVFAVAGLFAEGKTVIRDAEELKVKESNRIAAMTRELQKMGAKVTETPDGMIIEGGAPVYAAEMESYKDHRIAMSLAVAGLRASGPSSIIDADCVDISFPGFFDLLKA